jgi:hypothetical protein
MGLFNQVYPQLSAGTQLICSGLDGDKHGLYRVSIYFRFVSTSNGEIRMYPNGLSSNLSADLSASQGAPSQITDGRVGTHFGNSGGTVGLFYSSGLFFATRSIKGSTVYRTWILEGGASDIPNDNELTREVNGVWKSNAANLNNLTFDADHPIAVGSYVHIEQLLPDFALV